MTVHVIVTAEDIENGLAGDVRRCAAALALVRVVPDLGWCYCTFAAVKDGRRVELPAEVGDWITAFDNSEPVQPFEFDVEIPA